MADPVIEFDWLELPRRRLKNDKNNLIVVVGETGSGKSLACLDAAFKLDAHFSIDHVHFTIADFIADVRDIIQADEDGRQVCRTLVLDEAAVDFDARKAMSRENIMFSNLLKIFRYLNISVLFSFPNLEMFDVNGRRLMHFLIVMAGIDKVHRKSFARLFMVDSHKTFGGEPKRYFPIIDVPNLGIRFQVDPIEFDLPPAPLLRDYQAKKKAYGKKMVVDMDRILAPPSAQAEPEAPPVEIPRPASQRRYLPRL